MKKRPTEMQELKIRRITLNDAQTVRYRVYRSADDFIAVIAENALMAMKLTDIHEPYKIVRDLIASDGSISPFLPENSSTTDYNLSTAPITTKPKNPDLIQFSNQHIIGFEPLSLGLLRKESSIRESVVPPATLIRVLESLSQPSQSPEEALEPLAAEQQHEETKPLNTAQESLVQKAAISDAPLSPQDVVGLLSPNAD